MIIQKLFTEKYRPKSIDAMILLPRIKDAIFKNDQFVLTGNLLLTGTYGTGKTSLANILTSTLPTLKINASYDSSVDDLREEVTDFCRQSAGSVFDQNWDPSNKWKIVFFDEFDGISSKYQEALRGFIEEHSDRVRFVATCNNINAISPAIQSRFTVLHFDPKDQTETEWLKSEYLERAQLIAKKAGLNIDDNELESIINRSFPDLRTVFNRLQELTISGSEINNTGKSYDQLFDLFKSVQDTEKTYAWIIQNFGDKVEPALKMLGRPLAQWIFTNKPELSSRVALILPKVVHYNSLLEKAADPVVLLAALIFEIQDILNKK